MIRKISVYKELYVKFCAAELMSGLVKAWLGVGVGFFLEGDGYFNLIFHLVYLILGSIPKISFVPCLEVS